MRHKFRPAGLKDALHHFLPPELWKQAHHACSSKPTPSRWALHPLLWVLLSMAWCAGDSQEERFLLARAAYVSCHQKERRPGKTLAGFLIALARLPMAALRTLALGVRQQVGQRFVDRLRIGGWAPFACDGSRLECPRSAELQQRLGEAGKPDSAPMMYLTTLVLLPLGLLWSWRLGKGTASEHDHLRRLLPTLPVRSLVVADAFFLGYDLFTAVQAAGASFVVRLSSRAHLFTLTQVGLEKFREGLVYYWPQAARDAGRPPLLTRLLRVRGKGADVWLLTDVLCRQALSYPTVAQLYRWRWRNEGLFHVYKRMLGKVKLAGRTVRAVHREAESSLLALQLLLAVAAHEVCQGGQTVVIVDSPRRVLLRLRGERTGLLRTLGPRQFQQYQRLLEEVRSQDRPRRRSAKVRQPWPRRKDHKPPGAPKIRVMDAALKAKMAKLLRTVQAANC